MSFTSTNALQVGRQFILPSFKCIRMNVLKCERIWCDKLDFYVKFETNGSFSLPQGRGRVSLAHPFGCTVFWFLLYFLSIEFENMSSFDRLIPIHHK